MKDAISWDELEALIEQLRTGRLFDVQQWIAAGKPLNPPPPEPKKPRKWGPLEEAISSGFHSMVQVLLEAGANLKEPGADEWRGFHAVVESLKMQRLDLLQLIVENGGNFDGVHMLYAFETWSPAIMNYCIDHGGDPVAEDAMAQALCQRIRTALGVYKRYHHQYPDFQRQLNLALRYHTERKSKKWVALTLWAGADPLEQGPCDVHWRTHYDGRNAIEIALQKEWAWFFEQKAVRLDAAHPSAKDVFRTVCCELSGYHFQRFIDAGYAKQFSAEEGNEIIKDMLWHMENRDRRFKQYLTMLAVLFAQGWIWMPDFEVLRSLRRTLLKFGGENLVSFLELIRQYRQASHQILAELLRTPTIQGQLKAQQFSPDRYLETISW